MLRRPRPGGGRHPPPLAPTVSNFKPRAQWSTLESSMFLNVNLPGFYMDQIKITKDERARTINIEGQRPLSTQTRARFSEVYRVPESCDMTKLNTSFSHGLLTIEFPVIAESEKAGKVVHDKGKTVQRPNHEGNRGTGPDVSSVRRSRLSDKENQVGTSQEKAAPREKKEEPKTYKSVVEGKREVPAANRVKTEQKVKEGEASPSLGRKEHTKQEKVVEKKEIPQMSRQKTVQKVKDEEARGRPTVGGSVKAKVPAQEEKVIERKTEQKVKAEGVTKLPAIGGSSEQKVHAKAEKVIERKGNGEIGQKLKEERKTGLGQKREEKHTKPGVGDEARRSEKEISALNQSKPEHKTKERVERTSLNVHGNVIAKNDEKMVGDKVRNGEIQEGGREKKIEEANLVKETGDLKDNPQVVEPNKVDSGVPLLVQGQKETKMDPPAAEGSKLEKEESHKYDTSLVNVGVASLVIMVFGACLFVPLVKMFF
ncbi:BnaAnng29430D [Brassica napus]|uniref:BnaAnng29430D protein n=1 Tax=Brassica napus TaxID=3708 RepID=A0A078JUG0_BRANA|nr:BnaAnng29430D [Brassica napus]